MLILLLVLSIPVSALANQSQSSAIAQASTGTTGPTLQWNTNSSSDADWNPGWRQGAPISVTHQRLQEIRVTEAQHVTVPITTTVTVGNWHIAEQETRTSFNTFYVSGPNNGRIMVGGSWVAAIPAQAAVPGRPAVAAQAAHISGGTWVRDLFPNDSIAFVSGGTGLHPIGTARVTQTTITTSPTGREDARWPTHATAAAAASSRGTTSTSIPGATSFQHFIARAEINTDTGHQIAFSPRYQGPFASAPTLPANVNRPGGEVVVFTLVRTDTGATVQVFQTGTLVRGTTAATTERARVLALAQQAQRDFSLPQRWRLVQERSVNNGHTWERVGQQTVTHTTLRQAQAAIPLPNPARTPAAARWRLIQERSVNNGSTWTRLGQQTVTHATRQQAEATISLPNPARTTTDAGWFIQEGLLGQESASIMQSRPATFTPTGNREGPFANEAAARTAAAGRPARWVERRIAGNRASYVSAGFIVTSIEGNARIIDPFVSPQTLIPNIFATRSEAEAHAREQTGTSFFSRPTIPATPTNLAFANDRRNIFNLPAPMVLRDSRFSREFYGQMVITGCPVFSIQRPTAGLDHRARTIVRAVWPASQPRMALDTFVWRHASVAGATTLTRWRAVEEASSQPATLTRWRAVEETTPAPPTRIDTRSTTTPNIQFRYSRTQTPVLSPAGNRTITWVPVDHSFTEVRQDTRREIHMVEVTRPEEITVVSEVRVGSRLVK